MEMNTSIPWIYNGASRNQVETDSRYKETRNNYRFMLDTGRMLQLEDLETFPAPVVCPSCERPVITAMEYERSIYDWVNLTLGSLYSCGLCFPKLNKHHKSFIHRCPSCNSRLMRLDRDLSQALRTRVLVQYPIGGPKNSAISAVHVYGGGVYYQWNNNDSKIGTQAGGIGTNQQNNHFQSSRI